MKDRTAFLLFILLMVGLIALVLFTMPGSDMQTNNKQQECKTVYVGRALLKDCENDTNK